MTAIRKAQMKDYEKILQIYEHARQFMKMTGNPNQWGDTWPPKDRVCKDIEEQMSYVYVNEKDEPCCVFYYMYGDHCDPTYDVITEGEWMEDTPYGVVHRIASDGTVKGAGAACIQWAYEKSGHLRIDTHGDNKVMQGVLSRLGFTKCGIVYVREDNDPRYAYEKIKTEKTV